MGSRKNGNKQNNNQAQRGYSVGENIHHQNVAAGKQGFQGGKNYTGNLGSFMQKANAPKNDYRAESITQQKGGYTGSSVSPADMASAAGQFASSDKMKDKWRGRGGKFEALKSDPSIVNTMNQAKANLANWNATEAKKYGYPAGMNTIAGVKPLTNLMLDRNLNVAAGVNPTTGMGFMDSIKSNAYVDRPLPSAGKGIMGLLSGLAGVPGMALGMLPNLFKNLSTDIGNTYNAFGNMVRAPSITSGLAGLYDDFTQGLKAESVPLMQGVNNPFGNMFNTTPAMLTSGAGTGSAIAGMNRWGMPSEFDTDQGLWTGSYKSGAVAPEAVTQFSRQPVFTGEQTTMTPMRRPDQPGITDNGFMPYDMLLAGPLYGAGPFGPDDFVKQGFAENFNDVGQMDRFAQFHNNAPEFQKFIDPIHHPPAGGPLVANDTRIDQFIAGADHVGEYPNNIGMSQNAMDAWNYSG